MGRFGDFVGSREDLDRLLTSSAISWNEWRRQNPSKKPNLWAADLEGRSFPGRNLRDADLRHVHFEGADLRRANLRGAILRGSSLDDADLRGADLRDADLSETQLDHPDGGIYTFPTQISGAKLAGCNLASAKLVAANLAYSQLVDVDLSDANLDRAEVYGVATWDVKLHNTQQRALRITRRDQPYMSVDSFELAQFIYLLTDNSKLRDVLDTVSLKTVLILSRFTKERMKYIDLVRDQVRDRGKIPMVFDFEKPASKDFTGTIETLARIARFVVVDVSDPRSVPHELATVVPFLRTTPVLPLFDARSATYSMFSDLSRYSWVLKAWEYRSEADLRTILPHALQLADEEASNLRSSANG